MLIGNPSVKRFNLSSTKSGGAVSVYGGPFRETVKFLSRDTVFTVRMAKEIDLPAGVVVPTVDFAVPDTEQLNVGITEAVKALMRGEHLYVGCMGGTGRTGVFMACLARALYPKVADPVIFTRRHYKSHAVETSDQEDFVRAWRPPLLLRLRVWWGQFTDRLPV